MLSNVKQIPSADKPGNVHKNAVSDFVTENLDKGFETFVKRRLQKTISREKKCAAVFCKQNKNQIKEGEADIFSLLTSRISMAEKCSQSIGFFTILVETVFQLCSVCNPVQSFQ